MRELPKGWESFAIQELVELNPKNDTDNETVVGFIPMPLMSTELKQEPLFEERKWNEVKKGYTHFQNGDVLLAKITPCFENGKAGIPKNLPNGMGAGSTEYFVCRANDDLLCSEYLLAYFKTPEFMKLGELEMTGSVGHKRVAKEYLLTSEIPLPPLNEQKRIADRLSLLLTRIDKTKAHLDRIPLLLKRFRQSVLAAATSGRLTEDWREANDVDFVKTWKYVPVSSVGEVFLGRQRSPKNHQGENMRFYMRAANITWQGWNLSDINEMNFDEKDFERYKLKFGDVLINEGSGSANEVGKPAIWRSEVEDCCFQNTLICVRPYKPVSDYLYYIFLNAAVSKAFVKETQGVNIYHIGKERFAAFIIPDPTPEEQAEIVRRVEALFAKADRIEAQYKKARQEVDRLTPALLAKAFRGELVPQDPNDEPASVLLERVKAAKVPQAATKAKRQKKS